jgi:uncharacterized protein (TIGR02145 family)
VQAYATNSEGEARGQVVTFVTSTALPTLTTQEATNITSTSATVGSTITVEGSPAYTERGLVYSTERNPTVNSGTKIRYTGSTSSSITMNLTLLSPATTYYVKGYAIGSSVAYSSNEIALTTNYQVSDIEGNLYEGITIGSQVWLNKNLKATKFNDGTAISNSPSTSSVPAYAYYNNSASYKDFFGALYNGHVVDNSKNVCPSGWHIPTNNEWQVLVGYYGGQEVAGGPLKLNATGDVSWKSPNTGATNQSGLGFVGAGLWSTTGVHTGATEYGTYWSSTAGSEANTLVTYILFNTNAALMNMPSDKVIGASIRCIKD